MKDYRRQFKIDKITYSKCSLEQRISLPKITLHFILIRSFKLINALEVWRVMIK